MNQLWLIFLLTLACVLNLSAEEGLDPFVPSSSLNKSLLLTDQSLLPTTNPLEDDFECIKRLHKNENEFQDHVNFNHFESTLSAECEPLATIAGCVNVISGKFFQVEKDLKGTTIDSLDFVRYYDSGCLSESFLGFGFGSGFPIWASSLEDGAKHHYGMISERENFLLLYSDKKSASSKTCSIDSRVLEKGYTNLCRSQISGKTNFANWKAVFRSKKRSSSSEWVLKAGDGTRRVYDKHVEMHAGLRSRMNFPTKSAYLLTIEIKPNGNKLIFSYKSIHGKQFLKNIKTINRNGSAILNQLSFDYQEGICEIRDDCGHTVTYNQNEKLRPRKSELGIRFIQRNFLRSMASSQRRGSVSYAMKDLTWEMEKIQKQGHQFLKIEYYPSGRVKALYEPQETEAEVMNHRFVYHRDSTEVQDAAEQLTHYHFDDHQRISTIKYVDLSGKTLRKDSFHWSSKDNEVGWLKSKSIGIGEDIHYLKTYKYDRRGNILIETLYGNLTGKKGQSFKLDDKKEMDKSSLSFTYFDDERNLVKQKSTSEGLIFSYEYLDGTNLCTKTFCQYEGKIQERTFCTYDDNGELQTLIEDDGSGEEENHLQDVSFRKIKEIETVKEKGPSFGKPQKISEFYLNKQTGGRTLLKETFLTYDSQGCEREQKIIDSHGRSYVSTKVYDEYLNLKEEANALGYKTQYDFDENGNKISEELIGSGKKTIYSYDFANRLKEKKEVHANGQECVTTYKYNALHQLISEIDPYGQPTTYKYDRFGNQTHCIKPPIQDANGTVLFPTIIKEYNLLNQAISMTDENGAVTKYSYNIYGSPTKIIYPDESKERFAYNPCGWLEEKTHADGTSIAFRYDGKGHLIEKIFKDREGNSIKTEEYHYKGPLVSFKKDGMGLITGYEYDGAGRKVKETVGHQKTIHYRYDDFDRVIEKRQEARTEITGYDAIGRIIEKQIKENGCLISKETYAYDIQGNQTINTFWQSPSQIAVYTSHYLSDGNIAWKEDPLLHRTSYTYDHRIPYALGNQIKATATFDPLGRPTIKTYDPFHRLSKKEVMDQGQCVSRMQWTYDASGNCIKEHASVMAEGQLIRDYWIERNYNSLGLLVKESEMPQGKTTEFRYDAMNRLEQKIKPDGVKLDYNYDALGRLKTLTSSDGTIAYTYDYDLHDNVIKIQDSIHHITQNRTFDLYDRLEKEELGTRVVIYYTYDPLDRLTKLTLPDGAFIHYHYDAYHLKKLQRFNSSGAINYEVELPAYDLRGNLLELRSPAGVIQYTYDLLGRPVNINSSFWESSLEHFDAAGNLFKMKQRDPTGIVEGQFNYDRFNHLTSELSHESNQYSYDSIGNCLIKNHKTSQINPLNQLLNDSEAEYSYDPNGNLKTESLPQTVYAYDALNRLISCERNGNRTTFLYDAFGRCLQIADASGTKQMIYQGEQEIGSLTNGQLHEFRLIHPEEHYDFTFAIELQDQTFFPIQDFRGNICALQKHEGRLAEWYRYSAFGSKLIDSNLQGIFNPWRFANRREVANLSLFAHRFYNPRLMRWQTTDPLGFEEGLNLYTYVRNNPFCYKDPDGQFAIAIPVLTWIFGSGAVMTVTLTEIGCALGVAGTFLVLNNVDKLTDKGEQKDSVDSTLEIKEKKQTDKKKQPVRTEPRNLEEQLTLEEARNNPGNKIKMTIKDPKFPEEHWQKKGYEHTRIDGTKTNQIHYWENIHTGEKQGFKFKDNPN